MQKNFFILDEILFKYFSQDQFKLPEDHLFASYIDGLETIEPFHTHQYAFQFYSPFNFQTIYYEKLIKNGTYLSCNEHIETILHAENKEHEHYLFSALLEKALPNRLLKLSRIIRENNYALDFIDFQKVSITDDEDHCTNTYIFQFLKLAFIKCFLELQANFVDISDNRRLSEEDVYLRYLKEPLPGKKLLKRHKAIYVEANKQSCAQEPLSHGEEQASAQKKSSASREKFKSFGYKYKDKERLNIVLANLQSSIHLFDEHYTSVYDAVDIFCSNDIKNIRNDFYIKCETTQFRYILDKLEPHFYHLSMSNIEESGKFYTKNKTPLSRSNLYRCKQEYPKDYKKIDNIIRKF